MIVDELEQYLAFSRLPYLPAELNDENLVAVASDDHIVAIDLSSAATDNMSCCELKSSVLEFDRNFLKAAQPTSLAWVDSGNLCVGFDNGIVIGFDMEGEELFNFAPSNSPIKAIKVSDDKDGHRIWILTAECFVISALKKNFDEAVGYKISNLSIVDDFGLFVNYSAKGSLLFDDNARDSLRAIVVGAKSSLVVCDLIPSNSQLISDPIQNAKDRQTSNSSSYLSKSFYSFLGYSDSKNTEASQGGVWSRSKLYQAKIVSTFNDDKRRIFRVLIDPDSNLAVTADSLGRVMLYDVQAEQIVRVWKGLRDARLSWLSSKYYEVNKLKKLVLVIYAPQLGLASLYEMRHGPCQKVIAVGLHYSMFHLPSNRTYINSKLSVRKRKASRALVLKFHADKKTLEPFEIGTGASTVAELQQVAQFIHEHRKNSTDSGILQEDDLRISSMHATIEKVMAREDILCRVSAQLGQEVHRLLTEWLEFYHNADNRERVEGLDLREKAIISAVSQCTEPISLLTILAMIEYFEVQGTLLDTSFKEGSHGQYALYLLSPRKIESLEYVASFSVAFHSSLLESANRKLKELTGDSLILEDLEIELKMRLQLLNAYKLFNECALTVNSDEQFRSPAMQRDEVAQICRQNTFRAEALCWTLCSLKKEGDEVSFLSPSNFTSPSPRQSLSPTPSVTSPTFGDNNPSLTPQSSSPKKVIKIKALTSKSAPEMSVDSSGPTFIPASRSVSKPLLQSHHHTTCSYSLFRICFKGTKGGTISLDRELLFSLLHKNDTKYELNVTQYATGGFMFLYLSHIEPILGHLVFTPRHLQLLLEVVFRSLLGDLMSMHSFSHAMKAIQLQSPFVLQPLLPLIVKFIAYQPLSNLVNDILTKKMSTSPLQRWMRDHLLTLQDSFSSYLLSKQQTDDLDSNQEGSVEVEEKVRSKSDSSLEEYRMLQHLESEVVACYSSFSFDNCVRYIFRQAWLQCRLESSLEAVQSFSISLLETMYTVNDQVERRTFGTENLRNTIQTWETLIKQVRLLLFLKYRSLHGGDSIQYTLHNLSTGKLSISRVLAADSLIFALRSEQALEHERQCLEVYKRRVRQENSGHDKDIQTINNSKTSSGEVLLAWGQVADRRWRDLISIAVNDEGGNDKTPSDVHANRRRRRKPLLLYFPHHNDSDALGAYRSVILIEKWMARLDKMENLALVCEHLFDLSPMWRPVVSLFIFSHHVMPIVQVLIDLEEEKVNINTEADRKRQLLIVMGEVALMNSFIRSVSEIINFALEGKKNQTDFALQSLISSTLGTLEEYYTLRNFSDEKRREHWPCVLDLKLSLLLLSFYQNHLQINDHEGFRNATLFAEQNIEQDLLRDSYWSREAIVFHNSVLQLLQLRFQCGLRGVKLSHLIGPLLSSPPSVDEDKSWMKALANVAQSKEVVGNRFQFIAQSFRRLVSAHGNYSQAVSLSVQWGFSNDLTRLLLLKALLDIGINSRQREEEIEQLVPQFEDINLAIDTLISALRCRIGKLVAKMEKNPAFNSTLASLDSEAVLWVRQVAKDDNTQEVGFSSLPFKQDDLSYTRQVVLFLQGLLFAVPSHLRTEQKESGLTFLKDFVFLEDKKVELEKEMCLLSCSCWVERKTRCDALLDLCTSLLQSFLLHHSRKTK